MSDKKPELSAAMKSKLEPKVFKKNPIIGFFLKTFGSTLLFIAALSSGFLSVIN